MLRGAMQTLTRRAVVQQRATVQAMRAMSTEAVVHHDVPSNRLAPWFGPNPTAEDLSWNLKSKTFPPYRVKVNQDPELAALLTKIGAEMEQDLDVDVYANVLPTEKNLAVMDKLLVKLEAVPEAERTPEMSDAIEWYKDSREYFGKAVADYTVGINNDTST